MAVLSEAKSKVLPLNEFMKKFIKLPKKSASQALKEAKKRRE